MLETFDRITVSPSEAAALLGVSRPTVYELMARQDGPPNFRIGKRRLLPVDGLREWAERQAAGGNY